MNDYDEFTYGVRTNTPMGSFVIARDLTYEEANDLIKKLEKEAKENGSYFTDKFVLTYW